MSAWPIPEEVVEAFATVGCRCAPGGCAAHGCEECRAAAIDFFERHRLVQLPEEPNGWHVEREINGVYWDGPYDEATARLCATEYETTTGRIRPVYRIPGQPITVDKEENDGE